MTIITPPDLAMASDHAETIAVFNQMTDPTTALGKTELAKRVTSPDTNTSMQVLSGVLHDICTVKLDPMLTDTGLARTVCADIARPPSGRSIMPESSKSRRRAGTAMTRRGSRCRT
jgi:hypothetical protein